MNILMKLIFIWTSLSRCLAFSSKLRTNFGSFFRVHAMTNVNFAFADISTCLNMNRIDFKPPEPFELESSCESSCDDAQNNKVELLCSRKNFLSSTAAISASAFLLAQGLGSKSYADSIDGTYEKDLVWTAVADYESTVPERGTYSPRFIAYLARFLLNYDPISASWWSAQETKVSATSAQSFSKRLLDSGADGVFKSFDLDKNGNLSADEFYSGLSDQSEAFANFQASVTYGLRKYQGRDGVKSLFKLLLEQFGEKLSARRQIALLFSLLETNQPVELIRRLIGETDNGSIIGYTVESGGSGYTLETQPLVRIDPPAFLDDIAVGQAVLVPSGRIFRIKLTSPGKGYLKVPDIIISPPSSKSGWPATAIGTLKGDKLGGIVVTNPGGGYTEEDHVQVAISWPVSNDTLYLERSVSVATAEAVLDMKIASIKVIHSGSGYGIDLPLSVTVDLPPSKFDYANYGQAAVIRPIMSDPPEGEILRSWLPPTSLQKTVSELLPNNLVPKLDPCLGKFYISPIQVLDPKYCIYYDNQEFQVFPSEKISPYFSFLDGPRARYPVEKERVLDLDVFLRFAGCGAACGATAHTILIPIDVVKTKMQSEPQKYPAMIKTFKTLLEEEGAEVFLLGAGATIAGYFLYGGISFGLTEYFKRKFVEVCGPNFAALYPVPILLFASAVAAAFAATALTPFESLRIKTVTVPDFPRTLLGGFGEVTRRGQARELFDGVPVLLLAEIPFMMAKFATFDAVSKLAYSLFPQASESVTLGLIVSLVSGMVAGIAASIVSQPSDTVLVAVNGEDSSKTADDSIHNQMDIMGTVQAVLKEDGFGGFYKGAIPRAIKCAIGIALQFFLYDSCKRLAHVGPDDIKVFFDVMSGLEIGMRSGPMDVVANMIETNTR